MAFQRREFLRLSLAASAGGLAGCSLFGDENEGSSGSDGTIPEKSKPPANEWHSFQRTPKNNAVAGGTTVPTDPTERWQTTLSAAIDRQPVVGKDHLFVITRDGALHALNAKTGEIVWRESLGETGTECPCLVAGTVVAGTGGAELRGFDPATGAHQWSTDTPGIPADPTPFDHIVYTGTDAGNLLGIDVASGEEIIRIDAGDPVVTPPAVTEGRLYVGSGEDMLTDTVSAFGRATGTEQWQVKSFGAEAVLATTYRIVTVRRDGLYLYNRDGEIRGQSSATALPTATSDVLYIGGGTVSPIPLVEGGPDWVYWLEQDTGARAEVTGGMSLGDTTLCLPYQNFGDEKSKPALLGLAVDSGEKQWERSLPGGSPTAPVLADDGIFVGTDSGVLLALD